MLIYNIHYGLEWVEPVIVEPEPSPSFQHRAELELSQQEDRALSSLKVEPVSSQKLSI